MGLITIQSVRMWEDSSSGIDMKHSPYDLLLPEFSTVESPPSPHKSGALSPLLVIGERERETCLRKWRGSMRKQRKTLFVEVLLFLQY
jgi:hypothetical protein